MTPALRILCTLALIAAAGVAWCAAAYSWLMCIATIVLLPLVPVIFPLSAAVTGFAFWLSVEALDSAIILFEHRKEIST